MQCSIRLYMHVVPFWISELCYQVIPHHQDYLDNSKLYYQISPSSSRFSSS
ncbi:hypothetical protein MtrunA17_Chr5g0426801 [Medicago truncatula]|uniref:Uncharacterized protein n=1 Tax=Medicago truncatula TaxID=3880 RepID=A0A396HUK3_MEDTR|nr:hypothetical protein MtrunA17_Chr5g0426801 [Medicago truncatula]